MARRAAVFVIVLLLFGLTTACTPSSPPSEPVATPAPPPPPPPAEKSEAAPAATTSRLDNLHLLVAPILPGKMEAYREFVDKSRDPEMYAKYAESRANAGITRETVWLQKNPDGSALSIVALETPDVAASMKKFAEQANNFDKQFVPWLKEVHGMDPANPRQPEVLAALLYAGAGSGTQQKSHAFVMPIPADKVESATKWVAEQESNDPAKFKEFREKLGIAVDKAVLFKTPDGAALVVYHESPDPETVLARVLASEDPVVVEFVNSVKEMSGIDMTKMKDTPPNEMVVNYPKVKTGSAAEAVPPGPPTP
ncbi:MAG: hypothetical protein H6684_16035 [Deltaproteobacteria bacterium]|nr:hypothetical protein [Deltaproteobacteria bacterium]